MRKFKVGEAVMVRSNVAGTPDVKAVIKQGSGYSYGHVRISPCYSYGHVRISPCYSYGHVRISPCYSYGHVRISPCYSYGHVRISPCYLYGHVRIALCGLRAIRTAPSKLTLQLFVRSCQYK